MFLRGHKTIKKWWFNTLLFNQWYLLNNWFQMKSKHQTPDVEFLAVSNGCLNICWKLYFHKRLNQCDFSVLLFNTWPKGISHEWLMVGWTRKAYQHGAETYNYYGWIFQHPNQTWGQEVLVANPLVPELVTGPRIGFWLVYCVKVKNHCFSMGFFFGCARTINTSHMAGIWLVCNTSVNGVKKSLFVDIMKGTNRRIPPSTED